jgi:hypothetical protein
MNGPEAHSVEHIRSPLGILLALLSLAALLVGLIVPTGASALYDPVGPGSAVLKFDKGFLAFLKRDGVKLAATAPARLKAGKLTLPVGGGKVDPTIGKGTIEAQGALVFENQRKRLPLKSIALKTAPAPLIGKVGGSQLKVATTAKLATKRNGFGSEVSAKALKLTAKVATRLNKKLRSPKPFYAGQLIGQIASQTEPITTAILPTGAARLAPDPAFLAKLKALFVSLNPVAPAVLEPGPVLSLPIAQESALAPDLSSGSLRTDGAFELLQLGAGQVFLKASWLEFPATFSSELEVEPTPAFPGKEGRLPLLSLAAGSLSSDPAARTISDTAAPLTLSAKLAQTLDEAFAEGKPVFNPGEALGAVSFTAQGQ